MIEIKIPNKDQWTTTAKVVGIFLAGLATIWGLAYAANPETGLGVGVSVSTLLGYFYGRSKNTKS